MATAAAAVGSIAICSKNLPLSSGQASILKTVPSTAFFGCGLKKTSSNVSHTSTKANHFRVVAEIDETKQTETDRWKGLAFDESDDQQDIKRGKGKVDSLFQAPMGSGTHNVVMSSYEYLSTAQRMYSLDNMKDGYYIAPAFMDKLIVHISKNFMSLPNIKVPLILGIWGGKGQGKSFQCELVFAKLGINPIMMSAGELESGDAGEPAKLIRKRYREAADIIKKGKMCVLFINDLDAGAGRMGSTTQYTVNNQMVNATLMNIADNPTSVQLPGMYNKEENPRVPIVVTGNDFSTLYAPLIRDGRMEKFYWAPTREDRIGVCTGIFQADNLADNDVVRLVDSFPGQSIDFFGALRARVYDDEVRKWVSETGIENIGKRLVNSRDGPPTFEKPAMTIETLLEYGNMLVGEQDNVKRVGKMALALRAFAPPVICSSLDNSHMLRAAKLADKSAGITAPHPNAGCVIARGSNVVGEGFLYAQGTKPAEIQALEKARELSKGAAVYLNLEPGDCHGDDSSVVALVQGGVSKVVVGLRHPLKHFRGKAIEALRDAGIEVNVLGENLQGRSIEEAVKACQSVNASLLYREAYQIPFSVLKYAMTLDGKIAASTGHAAWVSSKMSRKQVFETRSRSDAIVVGGNTVRRDNPRLTTRQEGGHLPIRIVMSRTLNLPEDANLWDVSTTQTIVATQRGARRDFQRRLTSKGVEVVEFDILTPRAVMDYCYDRGFLSVLWECGGALSAPAIAFGVIHKVMAFVAPKIIGGVTAPSPVGELGMVEMTQALNLTDVSFQQIGPDMLISGYLQPIPDLVPTIPAMEATSIVNPITVSSSNGPNIICFYKAWDVYGSLSNFSPHPISMPDSNGDYIIWKSVEHYYQAQKFEGVHDSIAQECIKRIRSAESPEEAARMGRSLERQQPDLVRHNWESVKVDIMYRALKSKFSTYSHLSSLLVSTAGSVLVEASPRDLFWGGGREGEGLNHLGRLLMRIRAEILGDNSDSYGMEFSTIQSSRH